MSKILYTPTRFKHRKRGKTQAQLQTQRNHEEYVRSMLQANSSMAKTTSPSKSSWKSNLQYNNYNVASMTNNIPTTNDGTAKREKIYNGSRKLIGIAVLHKSCLVPVFDKKTAQEISKMRRG